MPTKTKHVARSPEMFRPSRRLRVLRIRVALAMAVCVVAIAGAQGTDSRQLRLTSKFSWYSGELKVSVKRADVTARRLLSTARALQNRTKADGVHFFLDPRAAEAFRFIEAEPRPGDYEAARHYLAV